LSPPQPQTLTRPVRSLRQPVCSHILPSFFLVVSSLLLFVTQPRSLAPISLHLHKTVICLLCPHKVSPPFSNLVPFSDTLVSLTALPYLHCPLLPTFAARVFGCSSLCLHSFITFTKPTSFVDWSPHFGRFPLFRQVWVPGPGPLTTT